MVIISVSAPCAAMQRLELDLNELLAAIVEFNPKLGEPLQ